MSSGALARRICAGARLLIDRARLLAGARLQSALETDVSCVRVCKFNTSRRLVTRVSSDAMFCIWRMQTRDRQPEPRNPSPRPSLRGFLRVQSSIPSGKHPARILIWKNSSEKGRARTRSRRRRKRRQTLPTPWPIGTALAQAPDRSRRRPGSGLHCHTVDLPEKGTKLVTWGAAMINQSRRRRCG